LRSQSSILAALVIVLCFAAIVIAVLWPNVHGTGFNTPFDKPADALDPSRN